MDVRTVIVVLFPDGTAQSHPDFTVQDVARVHLANAYAPGKAPLLISCPNFGRKLYYDENKLKAYVSGHVDFDYLLHELVCQSLYRNNVPLRAAGDEIIEPHSLWLEKNGLLVLYDDDSHATHALHTGTALFTKIA